MTKIVFVIAGTNTGGSEIFLLRWIRELKRSVEVLVIVRSLTSGDLHEDLLDSGAKLFYYPFGYVNVLKLAGVFKLLKAQKPACIVDLTGVFSGPTMVIAALVGIKRRISFHRRSAYAFQESPLRLAYAFISLRLVGVFATRILSNSTEALKYFHAAYAWERRKASHVSNLVEDPRIKNHISRAEVRKALGIRRDEFVLLHVGRLDPSKNHRFLIEILTLLQKDSQNVRAIFAGPGTEHFFNKFPEAQNLKKSVLTLGNRRDIPDLLGSADLFLFPSLTEGQPNALIEAMLAGLPVLASDIEPIKALIPPQYATHLISVRDPKPWVIKIKKSIADPVFRSSITYTEFIEQKFERAKILENLNAYLF
jgi:glycosyltransferase involved in cell wall biosynthesis